MQKESHAIIYEYREKGVYILAIKEKRFEFPKDSKTYQRIDHQIRLEFK